MEPQVRTAEPAARTRLGSVSIAGAALAPLVPPVIGWILVVALSGPPDYPSWPWLLLVAGVLAVPLVAGVMTRVLGARPLSLLPLLVAGLAGAIFGAWWGGLFAPPADPTSGFAGVPCVTSQVKGIAYAAVAAGTIVIPAGMTAWLVGPAGDRRRIVLAVVTVPLIAALIGLALFVGVTNVLSWMGPPNCQALYLG